jgi:hypothetical protein
MVGDETGKCGANDGKLGSAGSKIINSSEGPTIRSDVVDELIRFNGVLTLSISSNCIETIQKNVKERGEKKIIHE